MSVTAEYMRPKAAIYESRREKKRKTFIGCFHV